MADFPPPRQGGRGTARRRARPHRSLPVRLLRLVAFVPVLAVVSFVPILWPHTDPPAPADAVLVLSGDYGERREIANALIQKGLAPTLVFVGTPDRVDEAELCRSTQPVEFICLRPEPDSTRAEARAASRLAQERGWRSVVVVTSRYHVTRASILFRRCFDGRVRVMGGDPPYGRGVLVRQIAKEWPKVVYTVTLTRGC